VKHDGATRRAALRLLFVMHPPAQPQPAWPQQHAHPQGGWPAAQQAHGHAGYAGQAMVPAPSYAMQPTSGVQVTAKMIFLQWMLYLVQPVVTIGGHKFPIRWNQPHFFPLLPGWHSIRIHYPWFLFEGSPSTENIDVHQNHITDVVYRPSIITFLPGSLARLGYRAWC
jgi:hypothetical protein